jgi:hypothetical protein
MNLAGPVFPGSLQTKLDFERLQLSWVASFPMPASENPYLLRTSDHPAAKIENGAV